MSILVQQTLPTSTILSVFFMLQLRSKHYYKNDKIWLLMKIESGIKIFQIHICHEEINEIN